MKKIIFLSALIALFFGCDNNDDMQTDPVNPTDGFTHNNVFFETPNAYFEIDEDDDNVGIGGDGFPDDYSFFFSNGRMFDNDANVNGVSSEYLFSLNTTNWVFLNIEVVDNPSLANAAPSAGNTYVVSSINDSVILENGQIDAVSPAYFINSVEYGTGNETMGVINTPGIQGPSITINAINLDANNPAASTIDADYTFMNQNGEIITGHYEGTFGVILD